MTPTCGPTCGGGSPTPASRRWPSTVSRSPSASGSPADRGPPPSRVRRPRACSRSPVALGEAGGPAVGPLAERAQRGTDLGSERRELVAFVLGPRDEASLGELGESFPEHAR